VRNIAAKKGVTLIDDIPDDALVAADANILAISAENTAETVNAMLEAGADGFISKQQSGDNELAEAIRSVMNSLDYFGRDIAHIIYGVVKAKSLTQKDAPNFSERELDVIRLCSEGLLSKQIADRLGISPNTVTTYKERIFAKLDINSTLELVNYAMKKKIIYS
jgi:two-component system invasion response regulator UvrY